MDLKCLTTLCQAKAPNKDAICSVEDMEEKNVAIWKSSLIIHTVSFAEDQIILAQYLKDMGI